MTPAQFALLAMARANGGTAYAAPGTDGAAHWAALAARGHAVAVKSDRDGMLCWRVEKCDGAS